MISEPLTPVRAAQFEDTNQLVVASPACEESGSERNVQLTGCGVRALYRKTHDLVHNSLTAYFQGFC